MIRGACSVIRERQRVAKVVAVWKDALGDTRVFCAKSAEGIENKQDGFCALAKERRRVVSYVSVARFQNGNDGFDATPAVFAKSPQVIEK